MTLHIVLFSFFIQNDIHITFWLLNLFVSDKFQFLSYQPKKKKKFGHTVNVEPISWKLIDFLIAQVIIKCKKPVHPFSDWNYHVLNSNDRKLGLKREQMKEMECMQIIWMWPAYTILSWNKNLVAKANYEWELFFSSRDNLSNRLFDLIIYNLHKYGQSGYKIVFTVGVEAHFT